MNAKAITVRLEAVSQPVTVAKGTGSARPPTHALRPAPPMTHTVTRVASAPTLGSHLPTRRPTMFTPVASASQPKATSETNHFWSTSPEVPPPPANARMPAR